MTNPLEQQFKMFGFVSKEINKALHPNKTKCPNCKMFIEPLVMGYGEHYQETCPLCDHLISED